MLVIQNTSIFNNQGQMKTSNSQATKSVLDFTYLGSNITEQDADIRTTCVEKNLKRKFFQMTTGSVMDLLT